MGWPNPRPHDQFPAPEWFLCKHHGPRDKRRRHGRRAERGRGRNANLRSTTILRAGHNLPDRGQPVQRFVPARPSHGQRTGHAPTALGQFRRRRRFQPSPPTPSAAAANATPGRKRSTRRPNHRVAQIEGPRVRGLHSEPAQVSHLHGRLPQTGGKYLLLARVLRRVLAAHARREKALPPVQYDYVADGSETDLSLKTRNNTRVKQ
uniref:(northern house mosquito) hypothetical protein n=1 Tax=Culex pipiens TaxID=7175 RepID=A0A8D8KD41_CULPI